MSGVPTRLSFEAHLAALREAGELLAATVEGLDPATAVPTCPGWSVADLLAHQSMVHRWATAHLSGGDPEAVPDEAATRAESDLPGYYREGLTALLGALAAGGPDRQAFTFLRDAPAPGHFWARRQAHETTVHGVDALAARLGRPPLAAQTPISAEFALDGIDELVRGFMPRGRSRIRVERPVTVLVRPSGADVAWRVRIAERTETSVTSQSPDARRAAEAGGDPDAPDAVFSGSPVQLYLGLWNRGEEVTARGDGELLARWHAQQQVSWS